MAIHTPILNKASCSVNKKHCIFLEQKKPGKNYIVELYSQAHV